MTTATPPSFRPRAALALALALTTASAAQAELLITDWKAVGDQAVMWDTVSNRDWLRLDNTAGLSFNAVSAQLGVGGAFSGFAYAESPDIWALYANAGLTPSYPAPDAAAKFFVGSYGLVQWDGNYVYDFAITASINHNDPAVDYQHVAMVGYGNLAVDSFANATGTILAAGDSSPAMGSALWRTHQDVSAVPEPASAVLLLAGLLGLAALRRQR